ncbi:hypothetical protein KCG44_13895 [Pacificimonas sp. WHA3]|uniref:TonB-dependent receptor n=1 Tax=Pacificimonas pallii TaxID=2827236 RepID=A0ABS6SHG3_9SPHN|nr:hypothetical protein [Pacificimonas pallii]MBV7257873.1 hypothetical protein [Pacificimonas pallii]
MAVAPAFAQDAGADIDAGNSDGTPPPVVDGAPQGAAIFTPAHFRRFSPNTALEMARQIPGFMIERGDKRRGLGQGGANVLINGQRISGKSNDAVDVLSRIPAKDVIRLEVVEGASLDIPGLSGQVLNVLRASSGISGSFSYNMRLRTDQVSDGFRNANISVSGGGDSTRWSLGFETREFRGGEAGIEEVTDIFGEVIELRDEFEYYGNDRPELTGSFHKTAGNGNILNLNGQVGWNIFRGGENSQRILPDMTGIDNVRTLRRKENEFNHEVSADYEFALAGGRLKLIGLNSFEDSPTLTRFDVDFTDERLTEGGRFARDATESETIARAEYGWAAWGGDWQLSLEGALNSLEIQSALEERDEDGTLTPIDFDGAAARVEEQRSEIGLSYGRALSGRLSLQSSLGAEYSHIDQSGPLGLTRSFVRPKGFVSVVWAPNTDLALSARIERDVGQLNFFDFIASVNLNNDTENATNANLSPSQSWISEVEATQSLGAWGSFTARGYYEAISDIVDQIPVGDAGEAPGNAGSATRYGIEWTSSFLGDPIGFTGAKLDIELTLQRSQVDDPLTGERRYISDDEQRELEVNFRHDIPGSNLAWGGSFDERRNAAFVRLDSISRQVETPGALSAFVEHKDIAGLTVRGTVGNLLNRDDKVRRQVFSGRRTDPLQFTENRIRNFGTIFNIHLEGTF